MAQDFMDLVFRTETGQTIPGLLKYQGPIRVSLSPALSAYRGDLNGVLQTIRTGAGIDIATGSNAQIHIRQVPAAAMERAFPTAACVVASGVSSWAAFRRGENQRWSRQMHLQKAAIFIPDNAPPYIVRACLNEEIAQALGPVNDLYRIADSVFNDDNVHNRLTRFDLLMLRLLYSTELTAGASAAQVSAQLPALLDTLNPAGRINGGAARSDNSWKAVIETAMTGSNPRGNRIAAAQRATSMARGFGDHRLVHSLLVYGRLNLRNAPERAAPAFQEAYTLSLNQLGPNNLRTALTAMHIAAVALAARQYDDVITLTTTALSVAKAHQDPVLESGIQGLRALAFRGLGQDRQAASARLDSLAQARYAFGADAARVAAAQAELAGLIPAGQ
ncbi:MAG: DUF2927 domain-containing protein [Rhodobacteraceae bacterium]|nr:DUF2927 domain-containing protein [Paracoccaceae bacterium]